VAARRASAALDARARSRLNCTLPRSSTRHASANALPSTHTRAAARALHSLGVRLLRRPPCHRFSILSPPLLLAPRAPLRRLRLVPEVAGTNRQGKRQHARAC
jgi:hypothetical protein